MGRSGSFVQRGARSDGRFALNPYQVSDRTGEESNLSFAGERRREADLNADQRRKLRWVRAQMELILTEMERKSVHLRYIEELSYRRIGRALGISASSAHRYVQRGLGKLRAAAEDYRDE